MKLLYTYTITQAEGAYSWYEVEDGYILKNENDDLLEKVIFDCVVRQDEWIQDVYQDDFEDERVEILYVSDDMNVFYFLDEKEGDK